jgi:hypothetical protein
MFDFDSPSVMYSAMLIGTIGFALLVCGKKGGNASVFTTGLALSALPMVAHSLAILWGGAAVCMGGMWALKRFV